MSSKNSDSPICEAGVAIAAIQLVPLKVSHVLVWFQFPV